MGVHVNWGSGPSTRPATHTRVGTLLVWGDLSLFNEGDKVEEEKKTR